MPFQSQSQARGAFSGAFGPSMKMKAPEFAHATPGGIKSLPQHVGAPKVGAKLMRPSGRHPHLRMPGNRMPSKGAGMPNQNDMTMESLLGMMGGPPKV